MIISIHQPNFMPWYPFFQKIAEADIFVILTHCQFEKNNFQNRFNLEDRWYTMSTNKGLEPIFQKKYVNHLRDWTKIKKSLYNYNLDVFDECITPNLSTTNINIIKKVCSILGINTTIVTDYPTHLTSTERLLDLCKFYGGTTYLSGGGGKNYLDLSPFAENNISVSFQQESDMKKQPILKVFQRHV